ncbi:MAG: NAD-binding protein [Spirochaetales bacterium]|nr:NAD-binding protein [Spirochaetales bacterium]
MEKIGFIGLGVMGGHMARHLSARYDLVVFDTDEKRMNALKDVRKAGSVQEVGKAAPVVLLSLPSSEIVREVVTGEAGLAAVLSGGGAVIDTSTTEPTVSRSISKLLGERKIDFLDAPVSGGEAAARDATLSIMVGGPESVFNKYKPVLDAMGKSVIRVGETGAGEVAKLVNNMIVGSAFAVIAESFALGIKNGLDPAVLYEAIRNGWAGSKVLDVAIPGMINRDFVPGGSVDIHCKDLGYALSLAGSQYVPVPMTAVANEIFKAAKAAGKGQYAQHVIVELWEELLNRDGGKK